MLSSAWNALFLLGSINSLFLGLVLLNARKGEHRKANRYLSLILFSWSFGFFYTWMIETGLYRVYPHFILLGASFTFLTGPCLYLYMEALVGRQERQERQERPQQVAPFRRTPLLHFVPFLLNSLVLFPFYVKPGTEKVRYWADLRGRDPWFEGMQIMQLLHLGAYLTVLLLRLRTYRKNLGQEVSSLEGITLNWLRNLILMGFFGLGVYIVVFVLFRVQIGEGVFVNRFTDLAVLLILHVLGYEALTQPSIAPIRPESGGGTYARSSLSLEEGKSIAQKVVEHLRTTSAYLDETLSLRDLAMELSVPAHHLSQSINQHLQMNFFELVNRERVRHAKELLDSHLQDTLEKNGKEAINKKSQASPSILDIAFASGFRSKSTFNALFKQYVGCTPTEYCGKQKGNGNP
ncbi:MAG: hypothetical protein Kow009_00060 [Spirochaetales bacterium]